MNIKGKVLDENNVPLPGVNILIKGTTQGTQSDFDGNFSIQAENGDVLIFSYVGTKTIEKTVGAENTYDVVMESDSAELDEVVLVGYGNQKRSDITTAIATMSTDNLEERPLTKVDQALVGQMAGVRVKQTSGLPGAGFDIQIRGTGSISGNNQPLYVIDGFPLEPSSQSSSGGFSTGNPLSNLNPNDIESIQVLKDAAAAAIYGSRASNGVVIIKTKSGGSGKPQINFNTYIGVSETVKKLDVLSTEEWIERATEMIDYNWVNSGPNRTASQTAAEREAILGGFDRNFIKDERWFEPGYGNLEAIDWQDELFGGSRLSQYHNIAISGGTDMTKMRLSVSRNDDEGLLTGSAYERTAVNFKLNQKLADPLRLDVSTRITNSVIDGAGTSNNAQLKIKDAVQARPVNGIADELEIDLNQPNNDDDYQQFLLSLVDPTELVKQDWRKRTENSYRYQCCRIFIDY
ncbi:SusC/RagA family TonB-linked outer membrane protein [Mesonia mobilis]|uniref:SusC/RagA family TonB-linked outer membrane protein n=1 Tax=Mesonia mobilis TaxID=369791 RepID=UPI0026EA9657|nr:SusC/RagA family TonB-linked outer membrane protein [Mesonia mobilis]